MYLKAKRESSLIKDPKDQTKNVKKTLSGMFSIPPRAAPAFQYLKYEEPKISQTQPETRQNSTLNSARMKACNTKKIKDCMKMMATIKDTHEEGMNRYNAIKKRIKYRFPEEKEKIMIAKHKKFIEYNNSLSDEIKANSAFYQKLREQQKSFLNPVALNIDDYIEYKNMTEQAKPKINHRWASDPFKAYKTKRREVI